MRLLALILARGGSKRIPGKNIRPLADKPLIVWSIDIAKDIPDICDILVSTDDATIAEVAHNAGALVPWLRPAELSTDISPSVDACFHALDWYEKENGKVDGLLLLQPTSPFRSRDTVLRGIELFRKHEHHPVVGFSAATSHPMWCCYIEDDLTVRPILDNSGLHLRSQDLPPAYIVNGAFYLIAPEDLRRTKTFHTDNIVPLLIERPEESIDIDTDWDWQMAEAVLLNKNTQSDEIT